MKLLGTLTAAALVACGLSAGALAETRITGAGATFPANLYETWIAAFTAAHPGIAIDYQAVGSGEGIRRFLDGSVDFGATDRPLDDAQIAGVEGGVLHVPRTAGMVVVAYNLPGHTGTLRLSRATLGGIFAGRITAWNDPAIAADNPGTAFPDRTIALVTRRDSSGTTFLFSGFLEAASPDWVAAGLAAGTTVDWPGAMAAAGNEGVAARLGVTEFALGYVEYSFAQALDLPVAAIENRGGAFTLPATSSGIAALAASDDDMPADGRLVVADAASGYPITGYSWVLLPGGGHDDPAVTEGLRQFLSWGIGDGQALAEPAGYLPLPEPAAERARQILARLP